MNKNDFYKELLSQYTFDSEKIKMNAKRQKRGFWQSPAKLIPTVATAAAVTVTVGVFTFMAATNSDHGVSVKPETYEISAAQRLEDAEQNYRIAAYSNSSLVENVDMYVSFNTPMTYNEARILFSSVSDTGDIDFVILYTDNGKISADSADSFDGKVNGLKISAPSNYYKTIQDLSAVSVVELGSENVNDDSFTPISNVVISEITSNDTQPSEITLPEEVTPPQDGVTIGDSANITDTDTTYSVPTVTTIEYRVDGINDAIFINETSFVVITNTSVELNRIADGADGKEIQLISRILTDNPKISWSNDSDSLLFISGCDSDKNRNRLFLADGSENSLEELDISGITDGAEFGGLFYDEDSEEIVVKTYSLAKSYVYTGMMSDDGICADLSVESEQPITPLAYCDSVLYYAYKENDAAYVHAIDTSLNEDSEIWTHEGNAKFARSDSFDTAALIFEDKSYIFVAQDQSFHETEATGTIQFSRVNSTVFSDDNGYYTLTAAGVVEISSDTSDIYFTQPTNSVEYSVYEILADTVRIKIR